MTVGGHDTQKRIRRRARRGIGQTTIRAADELSALGNAQADSLDVAEWARKVGGSGSRIPARACCLSPSIGGARWCCWCARGRSEGASSR